MQMQRRSLIRRVATGRDMIPRWGARLGFGAAIAAVLSALPGCSSFGSSRIIPERRDYTEAIRVSEAQQLLKNIVRLRFATTPELLDLSQVVTQYQLEFTSSSGATLTSGGPNYFPITVGGQIQESPTITYAPVNGEDFALRMLSPVKPWQFYLLSSSGWDLSRLLMAVVQEVNGLTNLQTSFGFSSKPAPKTLGKFDEVTWLMETLEISGALKMTMMVRSEDQGSVKESGKGAKSGGAINASIANQEFGAFDYHLVFLEKDLSDKDALSIARLKVLLGLDDDRTIFPMYPSWSVRSNEDSNAIVMSNRSMLSILLYLTDGIELPDSLRANHPGPYDELYMEKEPLQPRLPRNFFTIHVQKDPPENPFVAVSYDGYWYWIDKLDQKTKTTFSLVEYLLRLQQAKGSSTDNGVLLTIPTR